MLGERGLNLRQGPALWSDILTIFKNAFPRSALRASLVPRAGGAGPSRRLIPGPFGARTLRQAEERERIQGRTRDRLSAVLRGQDLNLRPSGYEPDELPGCSTPRYVAVSPVVEPAGFEPATPCLQSRCSPAELRPRREDKSPRREDKSPAGKTRAPAGEGRWRCLNVVGPGRLELPTSRLSSARSNRLSYGPRAAGQAMRARPRLAVCATDCKNGLTLGEEGGAAAKLKRARDRKKTATGESPAAGTSLIALMYAQRPEQPRKGRISSRGLLCALPGGVSIGRGGPRGA